MHAWNAAGDRRDMLASRHCAAASILRVAIAAFVLGVPARAVASTATFNNTADGVPVSGTYNGNAWSTGYAGTLNLTIEPGTIPTKGYCVDLTHTISGGTTLPQAPADYPPEVLFILNNAHPQANTIDTPLTPIRCEAAAVQCALWHFTDNVTCTASSDATCNPILSARAARIVNAASAAVPLLPTRVPQSFAFAPASATHYLPGDSSHSVQVTLRDDQNDEITNQSFTVQVTSGPGAPANQTGTSPLAFTYTNASLSAGNDVIAASISYTIPTGQKFKLADKQGLVLAGSPITGSLSGSASAAWVTPQCGNGATEGAEQCDDGNSSNGDNCTTACKNAVCGDGYVDTQAPNVEQCDDGNMNSNDACTNACKTNVCGDQLVNPDAEECDDGNPVNTDGCTNDCHLPRCGDHIVQSGEACDDGNLVDTDGCTNGCALPRCGDGIPQPGNGETCDDGNSSDQDDCKTNCQLNVCGDGILDNQPPATEQCDDGNGNNTDGCSNTCLLASCGDGITQPGSGEECDDANPVPDDGCTNSCQLPECGDGITQPGNGEACDDGNAIDADDCAQCQPNVCGDGAVDLQPPATEECDDGNQVNDDGCNNQCKVGYCGDGVLQPSNNEQCDDGNTLDGDGCSSTCGKQDICANQADDDGDGLVDCEDANDCTCLVINPVCKHPCPAKIVFKPNAPDKFKFQVAFDPSNPNVDPSTVKVGITLTNANGIVFAAGLQPGDMVRGGRQTWKFRDTGAIRGNPKRGGISSLTIITHPQSGTSEYRVNAQVHADFSLADVLPPTQPMTLQVVLGNDAFQKTATWEEFRAGWKTDFQ